MTETTSETAATTEPTVAPEPSGSAPQQTVAPGVEPSGPTDDADGAAPANTVEATGAAEAAANGEPAGAASGESSPGRPPKTSKPPAPPVDPAEVAQRLKAAFPALFTGPAKPFKLRIQTDIQQRAPGAFSKQALSAYFRRQTASTSYLIAVSKAPHRVGLDGEPAGEIAEEHRKAAIDELARRRGLRQERAQELDQQRRNRATLLRDFERTTLTRANFGALKGLADDELERLLGIARQERAEAPPPAPTRPHGAAPHERRGPPGGDRHPGGRGGDGARPHRDGRRPPRTPSSNA